MADTRTPAQRRKIMQAVKTQHTGPEVLVRKILHRLGYRFRIHQVSLPGTPDIVLPRHRKIVQVHGCYWHGHGCRKGRLPKSRKEYWGPKIETNRARDARNGKLLRDLGWKVLTVWQCELIDLQNLEKRLIQFLETDRLSDPEEI